MTQQAINLSKGLEAMYFLDPTYYDGQRGVIEDQSGYGRHAQANGGPTVGVEGPDSFEATSFDGSDDRFDIDQTLDYDGAQTIVALVDGNEGGIFGAKSSSAGYSISASFDKIIWNFIDDSGTQTKAQYDESAPIGKKFIAATYNGNDTIKLYDDNVSVESITSISGHTPATKKAAIGATHNGSSSIFEGKIAFAGKWSRALSDAEIAYLNSLTAPVRSQL